MSVERYFSAATFMILSSMAIEKLLSSTERIGMRLAHRGLEVHAGKSDGGVTPDVDAELVRAASFAPIASPSP
jgi:hypothetical protein